MNQEQFDHMLYYGREAVYYGEPSVNRSYHNGDSISRGVLMAGLARALGPALMYGRVIGISDTNHWNSPINRLVALVVNNRYTQEEHGFGNNICYGTRILRAISSENCVTEDRGTTLSVGQWRSRMIENLADQDERSIGSGHGRYVMVDYRIQFADEPITQPDDLLSTTVQRNYNFGLRDVSRQQPQFDCVVHDISRDSACATLMWRNGTIAKLFLSQVDNDVPDSFGTGAERLAWRSGNELPQLTIPVNHLVERPYTSWIPTMLDDNLVIERDYLRVYRIGDNPDGLCGTDIVSKHIERRMYLNSTESVIVTLGDWQGNYTLHAGEYFVYNAAWNEGVNPPVYDQFISSLEKTIVFKQISSKLMSLTNVQVEGGEGHNPSTTIRNISFDSGSPMTGGGHFDPRRLS